MDSISLANAILVSSKTDTITWSPWWGSESYPAVFCRDDMTSAMAWVRLIAKDTTLQEDDFVKPEQYWRYLILILHLLEYSCILIAGQEGGGKSLLMAVLTSMCINLFPPKAAVLDWFPPVPEKYNVSKPYYKLKDSNFTDRVMKDLNKVNNMDHEPTKEDREKLIISNSIMGLDECSSYGTTNHYTNLMELLVRLSERRRHFDLSIITVWQDPKRIPGSIYDRRTHEISCFGDYPVEGVCTYYIFHKKTGTYRYIPIVAEQWKDYWNTKSWTPISHEIPVSFSANKNKKVKHYEDEY
jgi:hypothetical protein